MATPSVVHVVLVRWKPEVSRAALEKLTELAVVFPDTIPGVLAVHCGPSTSPEGLEADSSGRSSSASLAVQLETHYLPHPAHQPVAQLISRLAEQVVVFDVDA